MLPQDIRRSFVLDISSKRAELEALVSQWKKTCYQLGNERHPEIRHYERPCIHSRPGKWQSIKIGSTKLKTPYAVAFALEYGRYPRSPFMISHGCGNGPCCIEPTHMHISTIGENNQHKTCHRRIREIVKDMESTHSVAEREGTIGWRGCRHNPTCFLQFGKLEGSDRIWFGPLI